MLYALHTVHIHIYANWKMYVSFCSINYARLEPIYNFDIFIEFSAKGKSVQSDERWKLRISLHCTHTHTYTEM